MPHPFPVLRAAASVGAGFAALEHTPQQRQRIGIDGIAVAVAPAGPRRQASLDVGIRPRRRTAGAPLKPGSEILAQRGQHGLGRFRLAPPLGGRRSDGVSPAPMRRLRAPAEDAPRLPLQVAGKQGAVCQRRKTQQQERQPCRAERPQPRPRPALHLDQGGRIRVVVPDALLAGLDLQLSGRAGPEAFGILRGDDPRRFDRQRNRLALGDRVFPQIGIEVRELDGRDRIDCIMPGTQRLGEVQGTVAALPGADLAGNPEISGQVRLSIQGWQRQRRRDAGTLSPASEA